MLGGDECCEKKIKQHTQEASTGVAVLERVLWGGFPGALFEQKS